jgi:hypothetical protein
MAKKRKAVIDLSAKGVSFPLDDREAKLVSFNQNSMTLVIDIYENGVKTGSDRDFPFAHLPKSVKKLLKPL